MYISVAASLLRRLKVDFFFLSGKVEFGLNCSRSNSLSSFLKCYFNWNILTSDSSFVLRFALSIELEIRRKLSPFDNKDISESVRFHLDKFTTFLFTKLPCNLLSYIFARYLFTFTLLSLTEVSFSRLFPHLRHIPIHLNVKDNVTFQNQE